MLLNDVEETGVYAGVRIRLEVNNRAIDNAMSIMDIFGVDYSHYPRDLSS